MPSKKNNGFYLACSSYPRCRHSEVVPVGFVNEYLTTHVHGGVRCQIDNTPIKAKVSRYGLYLTCNGITQHKFRLDEI
jgi:ssDNA-binding Zn-finger/Zn-ribbon topoisomerase 1